MSRRAVLYARQSLDRDGEGLAVQRQVAACRELVERKGWQLVHEYVDNDTSATSGKRPAYTAMLDRVRAGGADVIVSWAPDRLARRPRDLEDILDLAEQHGVTLATIAGDVDLSTPYGQAITRIFGAIARQETQQKGVRQRAANAQRANGGRVPWTRRPFGYDLDDGGAVVLVAAEAAELRRAALSVLAGGTVAALVRDLNARQVPTSAGGQWTVTTLRRLLTNPRTAGRAAYRGTVVGAGDWPAILTGDEHDRLVAHLEDPARRTQTGTTRKYLLSGAAVCGRCGERMFASPMGQKGAYWMVYRCRSAHLARRMDLVDEVVQAAVVARLSQPDAAGLLVSEGEDADRLREEAVELRGRLDQLASLLVEGVLTADGVREQSARLRRRLEEVERRRVSADRPDALAALVDAEDVAAAWAAAPLDARRQVVDVLMTVTVLPAPYKGARFAPEQVTVTWR